MRGKTDFLQIRVTPAEKTALRRLADQAGQDVSAYVLSRALPAARLRFQELLRVLRDDENRSYVIAELNDLLTGLPAPAFADAVADADLESHSAFSANYVAAMVEHAATLKGCAPPAWSRRIDALEAPWFAADLKSLRPWLLVASPVAFKRRNLFVDASIGDRI